MRTSTPPSAKALRPLHDSQRRRPPAPPPMAPWRAWRPWPSPRVARASPRPSARRPRTADWSRAKRRVKEATDQLARELLQLYAAREMAPGHAYAQDSPWQYELEESFPYVETPDQLRAISEVKADMEQPRPMDRLVCGDVGYGKTEVALRAAFKAVMDGRQVAVLVPTTVLAQQHYTTFSERLAAFPVNVA